MCVLKNRNGVVFSIIVFNLYDILSLILRVNIFNSFRFEQKKLAFQKQVVICQCSLRTCLEKSQTKNCTDQLLHTTSVTKFGNDQILTLNTIIMVCLTNM